MTDRPQGPGWWQASDLKWYPPEQGADYVAPPSTSAQPPSTTRDRTGRSKVWFTLAGTALLLVTAALVASRVLLGNFLPGLVLIAAIAIIAITVAVRSSQSVAHKAMAVTAIALVLAAAVPASLKVVYPAYHHFFDDGSTQASSPPQASRSSQASVPSGSASSQASAPNGGPPPSTSSPRVTSGILALTNAGAKKTYGFIDPNSGQYSEVASFNIPSGINPTPFGDAILASPDFTKYAFTKSVNTEPGSTAGWIDAAGNFTAVSPTVTPGAFGGSPPLFTAIGFDGAGNFYYKSESAEVYKLAAGSTTDAQKITLAYPNAANQAGAFLNYDGTMQFGCTSPVKSWLGPNAIVSEVGSVGVSNQIVKWIVTGRDKIGCPTDAKDTTNLLPATNTVSVADAVGNRDGTQVAFKYANKDNTSSLYIIAADGTSQPKKVNLPNITEKQLASMTLLKWQ
jgi:hypothetical protein